MRPQPDVAICVAVYQHHAAPNVNSLASDLPAALDGIRGELVVLLNGVSRGEANVPPEAQLVEFEVNRGVPVAWNAAVRASRAEIVCVINDDVRLGVGAVKLLCESLERAEDAGVVGPVGSLWDLDRAEHMAYVDTASAQPATLHECDVVSGFMMAMRRSVFDAVGGFDEAYTPCGFEEVDLCTAVRLRAGLRCYAVAGVPFEHEFGISASRPWARIRYDGRRELLRRVAARNRRHFRRKWSAQAAADRAAGALRPRSLGSQGRSGA